MTIATAAPAATGTAASGSGGIFTTPVVPTGNAYRKHIALRDLVHEGREMQAADGGKLTPAHLAYLQAKLDAIRAGNY